MMRTGRLFYYWFVQLFCSMNTFGLFAAKCACLDGRKNNRSAFFQQQPIVLIMFSIVITSAVLYCHGLLV